MATATQMLTGVKFQSPSDTDKVKTTWILKALNNVEFMECTQKGYVDHAMFVHKGLTGWKDFVNAKGKQIKFDEEFFCQIPPDILLDISLEVQGLSSLSENERKNLLSQLK